jgi:hypothetical protein
MRRTLSRRRLRMMINCASLVPAGPTRKYISGRVNHVTPLGIPRERHAGRLWHTSR